MASKITLNNAHALVVATDTENTEVEWADNFVFQKKTQQAYVEVTSGGPIKINAGGSADDPNVPALALGEKTLITIINGVRNLNFTATNINDAFRVSI